MKKEGTNSTCCFCKTSFYRSPANRRSENSYCSRDCMSKAFVGRQSVRDKRKKIKCVNCGSSILRPEWHINQTTNNFCNIKCFSEYKAKEWTGENNPCWRGGKFLYYGKNWIKQQKIARQRDHNICQMCKIDEKKCRRNLDVHHIVPFRMFQDKELANHIDNLICLCGSCHKKAENKCKNGEIKTKEQLLNQFHL